MYVFSTIIVIIKSLNNKIGAQSSVSHLRNARGAKNKTEHTTRARSHASRHYSGRRQLRVYYYDNEFTEMTPC